jgi:hypothetical protein
MDRIHGCREPIAVITLTLALLMPASAQLPKRAPAQGAPGFEMSAQQEVFRRIADEFIAAAAAGDEGRTTQMLSPTIAARVGREAVARFLSGEVLPFFAPFKEAAGSVTVTRTSDAVGFVFYMHMVSRADEYRPFVIYVIEEEGAKVVANVLVDNFVEGRHCARVAGGWQCPDFR